MNSFHCWHSICVTGWQAWYAGDSLTWVDFVMYELVDQHLQLQPDCLKGLENLQQFQGRFEQLQTIEAYMKSPAFMKAPINNKMAKFGSC